MGLFQKAVETYDAHEYCVGMFEEGKEPLSPISHTIIQAGLVVTVSADGAFEDARLVGKDEPKIIIPVTEESGGRSGKNPPPHPLCDKLEYVAPGNEKKHGAYLAQLSRWACSPQATPMLTAIWAYVERGTIMHDLERVGVSGYGPDDKKDMGSLVCWRVTGEGPDFGACWQNQKLFRSFIEWYASARQDQTEGLCMIEGEVGVLANNHPKKIVSHFGNAKLISSNDDSGFTFRGRFSDSAQAATIGYVTTQKVHCALSWLSSNQGASFGKREFICWNPYGITVVPPTGPFRVSREPLKRPSDYKDDLRKTLEGHLSSLPADKDDVVIVALDAATTGRLAVAYYNELKGSDYYQRLLKWDETCCWPNGKFGIQAPSLYSIANYAFGTFRSGQGKFVTDEKVLRLQMQRLVSCRVDGRRMPFDVVRALVGHASTLGRYESDLASKILFVACAVVRKYWFDNRGEEIEMSLDREKNDRSYQFGRLLAVLDAAESACYGQSDKRTTNAIRRQPAFKKHPLRLAANVHEALDKAYFPSLLKSKPGLYAYFKSEIAEIFDKIHSFPERDWNKQLGDTYLVGFYLERSELYKGKQGKSEEEE